jgi:hypothetical protein
VYPLSLTSLFRCAGFFDRSLRALHQFRIHAVLAVEILDLCGREVLFDGVRSALAVRRGRARVDTLHLSNMDTLLHVCRLLACWPFGLTSQRKQQCGGNSDRYHCMTPHIGSPLGVFGMLDVAFSLAK